MLSASGQGSKFNQPLNLEAGFSFSDFAILYRTGRQAESLEKALAQAGLPYRVVGKANVLESAAVTEFLSLSRLLIDPNDLFLLRAVLSYPRWGLTGEELNQVIGAIDTGADRVEYLTALTDLDLNQVLLPKVQLFATRCLGYRSHLDQPTQVLVRQWLADTDQTDSLDLRHLELLSEEYARLEDFLRFLPLALEADLNRRGDQTTGTEAITLSTLHAAKGLEFPVVFIYGVEEGFLPLGLEPNPERVAEEQRLFYVGLTRTRNRLYLVNSLNKLSRGEPVPVEVSRFLKILPSKLLEKSELQQRVQTEQLELF